MKSTKGSQGSKDKGQRDKGNKGKVSKSSKSHESDDDDAFVSSDAVSSSEGNYFKPQPDENRVRIISMPIFGWLEWTDEDGSKKPVRTAIDEQPESDDEDNRPKKFMTVAIIDREDDDKVKIWEITQQSIIKSIKALSDTKDWGKPFTYDIIITKTGEDLRTKYVVTPCPKKPLDKNVIKEAQQRPCNLDKLFAGGNPWETEDGEETEYFFK